MTDDTNKLSRLPRECNVGIPACEMSDKNVRPTLTSRFTLVEILVVIGIMALIMYVVLPSFARLAKGGGVEYSASNLVGRLGITRSTAIGKNMYAALLLPSSLLPAKYLFSANRICYVTNNSGTYNFLAWVPNETWEFMPAGTVIFRANNSPTYTVEGSVPDGISDGTAGTHYSVVNNVKCSDIGASYTSIASVRAIIFSPSGKLAATGGNRYVKVGEGTYSSGATPTLTSKDKQNWVNVTIDQFTGRITYGNE